jgi:RNA polymerase sigma factor (sigma-70 family)
LNINFTESLKPRSFAYRVTFNGDSCNLRPVDHAWGLWVNVKDDKTSRKGTVRRSDGRKTGFHQPHPSVLEWNTRGETITTMHDHSDEDLFGRYVDGDESALNTLIARYNNALYHYILGRIKCATTAEDVLQLTYIKLVKYKNIFDQTKLFKPWLYTITDRLCNDHLRSAKRRRHITQSFGDLETDPHARSTSLDKRDFLTDHQALEPYETVCRDNDARQALSLLRNLPKKYRSCIHFLVINELSSRKAARLVGTAHKAVQTRAAAGLAILREQMENNSWGEDTTLHEIEECVISDLVKDMPQEEIDSLQRVHAGDGDERDHQILGGFICRLLGAA